MSICRECKKNVNKYTTMFGYCPECCIKLGANVTKIKWNVDEEKSFLSDVKEYIICKACGYLIKSPEETLMKCPDCGIKYEESKSFVDSKYKNEENKII